MISTSSLKFRIFANGAIMVALVLASAVVGYLGLTSTLWSFQQYRQAEGRTAAVLEMDRDVQELRRRVGQYTATGNPTQRDAVRKISAALEKRVADAISAVADDAHQDPLHRMLGHLQNHSSNFELVVDERQIRTEMVREQLPTQADAVQVRFEEFAGSFAEASANENLVALLSAQHAFASAQTSALRYFASPDSLQAEKTLESLAASKQQIGRLNLTTDADKQQQADLLASVEENERTFFRAVQATRAYLYLTNVVMAGEASEIMWRAAKLNEAAATDRQNISQQTERTAQLNSVFSTFFVVLTIAAALLVAGGLIKTIVTPISKITATFQELAGGRTLKSIPGKDRADEIGEMAKAAQVFSDKNLQTETLLTESRQLSEQLAAQTVELQTINNQLDNFAYVASHDLKSPLRGISQLANWIQEDLGDTIPEQSSDHLDRLQTRIGRLDSLLQELLDYSRVGRTEHQLEEVDVHAMLVDSIEILDNAHGMDLKLVGQFPVFSTLKAPLSQTFLNLISNAIKHNHRGADGVVEVSWREFTDYYEFSVADNGPGIDEKDHDRVFQMYQRVGDRNVDGTGMGLAIVKKQIDSLGGEISIESKAGEGACFRFRWPKQAAVEASPNPSLELASS